MTENKETRIWPLSSLKDEGTIDIFTYPNDELRIDQLQSQHSFLRMIWQDNFSVPIEQQLIEGGMHVLDIGTGSGVWVLEMASEYPLTKFKGIDSRQLFPADCFPENSEFIQWDILKGLPFEDETFDFIHIRLLFTAYTMDQWKGIVMREILRVCKVGGWVQFMEWDHNFINEGPNVRRFSDAMVEFIGSKNINYLMHDKIDDLLLSDEKFSSVQRKHKYCPTGDWGGKLGLMGLDYFAQTSEAFKLGLTDFLNMSLQEYDKFIQDCLKEFEVTRTYVKSYRFYAQKSKSLS